LKNLYGDVAPQAVVACAIDLAHAPLANEGDDLVVTEPMSGGQPHRATILGGQ
jgi:hypothetical protein